MSFKSISLKRRFTGRLYGSKRASSGQSLVEFALVLPLFLIITVAGVDVANLISVTHRLSAATREGARLATETTDTAFATRTQNAAVSRTQRVMTDAGIPWWNANVTAAWTGRNINGVNYTFLRVSADYTPPLFFGRVMRTLGFQNLPLAVRSTSVGYAMDTSQFFAIA